MKLRYGIPQKANLVRTHGQKLSFSELAIFTGHAGKVVSKLWQFKTYGYAILEDGTFIHGSLSLDSKWVSLS